MITEYNIYLEENIIKDIKSYLRKYINPYVIIVVNDDKIYLEDKDNNDTIMLIIVRDGEIQLCFYKDLYSRINFDYDDIDKFYKKFDLVMNSFYEKLKRSNKLIEFLKFSDDNIVDIPIVDIEKYCDFIVYVYEKINSESLKFFISNIYNYKEFEDIKKTFDIKYKYLVNANSFDLI
jgi:hypothetical protein